MKRLIAIIAILALALAFAAACATPEPPPAATGAQPAATAEPTAPDTEPVVAPRVDDLDDEEAFFVPTVVDEDHDAGDEFMFPAAVGAVVGFMLKNHTNPVWIECGEGAQAAADFFGMELLLQAPIGVNTNLEQIQLIEQAIAQGVDIYVLIPDDSIGILPAVIALNNAGIPVINLNTWINNTDSEAYYETFVIADNIECATYAAHELARLSGGVGEVVLLQGPLGGQVTIDLTIGAERTFALYPGIEIVDRVDAEFSRATAYRTMQNLLVAHPNLRMVFSCNDEMALGALEALEEAGRRNNDENHIFIGGIDGNQEAVRAVMEGRLDFTVNKSFWDQGWAGIEVAAMFLQGYTLDPVIPLRIDLILQENAHEFLR